MKFAMTRTHRTRSRAASAVLALSATLLATAAGAQQAPLDTAWAQAQAAQAPQIERESTLTLPFEAPTQAISLVIAHDLPSGGAYVAGSSTLNGASVPDPKRGPSGRLYWDVPAAMAGVLEYRVAHTQALPALTRPALFARYERERAEVLSGRFDERDYAASAPSSAGSENAGGIKLPLAGTVYRERDRITVVVEGPLSAPLVVRVNGEVLPRDIIGKASTNEAGDWQRVEFVGVRLREGVNTITLGNDTVTVAYAGKPVRVEMSALQLLADGASPLRVKLRSLDENGVTTAQSFLTVRSSLEPSAPDANPGEVGYQVRLENGEGVLELPAQSVPVRFTVEALLGDKVMAQTFDATPDPARVGVGALSFTAGLQPLSVTGSGQGYYEGMLGEGKLYVAGSSRGLPNTTDPNVRYPAYGDASTESIPLQGIDPVAFRYEHPTFSAQYRSAPLPEDVFGVGEHFTALSATTRGDVRVSGFAALVPQERVRDVLVPDGTRLLHLSAAPISPDSESVERVVRDRRDGKELRREILRRLVDYTLDFESGVLTFTTEQERVDRDLNDVRLEVTYRTAQPLGNRALAWGAQVATERGPLTAAAAVVHLDGVTSSGVKAAYTTPELQASASAATAGGGVQAGLDASVRAGNTEATALAHYQSADYTGLNPFGVGLHLNAKVHQTFTPTLGAGLDADYLGTPTTNEGRVTATGQYTLNAWRFGAGLKTTFGDSPGVFGVGNVGYHAAPVDIDVAHAQPFGVGAAVTNVTLRCALTPLTSIVANDEINWQTGQRASVGLESKLGGTNLNVAYDLPTASGAGNRARFGADTTFALSPTTSLSLSGGYLYDMTVRAGEYNLGTGVRYSEGAVAATAASDFAVRGGQLKTVLRGGVTGSLSNNLTLTADATAELSATPGARFALGYAYRASEWNTLGYLRYQDGSLAGAGAQLLGQVSAEYHRFNYALRGALDTRVLLDDPDSFTYQPSLSATWYLNDRLGVGAGGRALLQPGTNSAQYGLGLEGSLRVLSGTWATLGYNVLGFDGLGSTYTRPGAYLRLDILLDEQSGGR